MWGVFARKISSKGAFSPAKEFLVNQFKEYNQRKPAVATLANGNYVIAWILSRSGFTAASMSMPASSPPPARLSRRRFRSIPAQIGATRLMSRRSMTADLRWFGRRRTWQIRPTVGMFGGARSAGPARPKWRISASTHICSAINTGPNRGRPVRQPGGVDQLAQDGSREGVYGRFLQAERRWRAARCWSIRLGSVNNSTLRWRGTGSTISWWSGPVSWARRGLIFMARPIP